MTQRLAVVGTGAIGAPIGGLLTRAGYDVTLIDQWPDNVEAMRSRGLRLTIGDLDDPEFDDTIAVRAMHVHEVCSLREPFDVVFLACKSYDTRWLVQLIEPHLRADGVVVSVQNSLNEEWIAPIVGSARAIGCTLMAGGELLEAGHVWRNRRLSILYYTIGELSGELSPRIHTLATILSKAGKTTVTTNIRGAKWSKLVTNCASAALSSLVDPRRREWDLVGVGYHDESLRADAETESSMPRPLGELRSLRRLQNSLGYSHPIHAGLLHANTGDVPYGKRISDV